MVMLGRRGLAAPWVPPAALTFVDQMVADSTIDWWRVGEGSGTNADNVGSGARDGTYIGTPTLGQTGLIAGDANTAVLFPTAAFPGRYIDVVGYSTVPATPTISAWVKGTSFADNGLLGWRDGGSVANFFIYMDSTIIRLYCGNSATDTQFDTAGANALTNGNKHCIAASYDGSAARIYYDGALVAGPITKTFSGGTASDFKIGQYGSPSGSALNGVTIDEPAVFSTALSAARLLAHWNSGN